MKKENIYKLVENSLKENKSAYLRFLNSFATDLKLEGYSEMHDAIRNLIDQNTRVLKSSNNDSNSSFIKTLEGDQFELESLIKGIEMGIIKSAFFHGSPGTGKTSFAKEISKLTNYKFVSLNIGEILDSRLGESIKNLESFLRKNINTRKIIFIDEADSLFTKRGMKNDVFEMERLLTTMLQVMDQKRQSVIILASNLLERIDKAILRRFDILIDFDKFKINTKYAIENSDLSKEWDISSEEIKVIDGLVKRIKNLKIYDVDTIIKKYLINTRIETTNKKPFKMIEDYITQLNFERGNNE